ncbi:MAG: L,D-transpeptidase family protein, partial [Chloroflexota bacterium]|nr:L,D-transpeptidase family protein [Chloroflexota bacterium]
PWLAPPYAPIELQVETLSGDSIQPDGWTNQGEVRLGAQLTARRQVTLLPQVELRPAGEPFTGEPNLIGKPGSSWVTAPLTEPGGRYQWRIRAMPQRGFAGPWAQFSGTIGYEPNAPPAPNIRPLPRDGYVASRRLSLAWTSSGNSSGEAGFAYSLDRSAEGQPASSVRTSQPHANVVAPADGDWFFHLKVADNAGNWSPVATIAVHVDTVPIQLAGLKLSLTRFNPAVESTKLTAAVNKATRVAVSVLAGGDRPVRTVDLGELRGPVTFQWDGKDDQARAVPAGDYHLRLTAEDKAGSRATALSDALTVMDKRIVVSLGQQKLIAYQGDKLFLQTLVTTGGPELPTPTGTFHVLSKFSPFKFHSPWPKDSPFWYPDSPTTYAMLFDPAGYFIHDAPWRSWFGPGSNAVDGKPGGDGTGTHGCVNVPLRVEAALFAWTPIGAPVIVQP